MPLEQAYAAGDDRGAYWDPARGTAFVFLLRKETGGYGFGYPFASDSAASAAAVLRDRFVPVLAEERGIAGTDEADALAETASRVAEGTAPFSSLAEAFNGEFSWEKGNPAFEIPVFGTLAEAVRAAVANMEGDEDLWYDTVDGSDVLSGILGEPGPLDEAEAAILALAPSQQFEVFTALLVGEDGCC